MKPKFLPGDMVTFNNAWYKGYKLVSLKDRKRYIVTGYSDLHLRTGNPVVTLRTRSRNGRTRYESFHQDWLMLV